MNRTWPLAGRNTTKWAPDAALGVRAALYAQSPNNNTTTNNYNNNNDYPY